VQLLHSITVAFPVNPQRIDVFLSSKLRKYSRNKIQNLIFKQAVLVNAKPVDADYKVQVNDVIEVFAAFKEFNENVTPENIPLDIIYEDEAFIVLNKPVGMPVHKGLGNYKGTLLNALAFYFLSTGQKVNVEEGSVHRLDSGTSGLIVFAKNRTVKKHLESQVKNNLMHRTYCALVWGVVHNDEGTIDVPVGRNKNNPMVIQAFPLRDEGKEAVTHYKVLKRFKFATLVQCELQSGRTHQIRIHLQFIGHPIIGDQRYASSFTFKDITEILKEENITHQLLHAQFLEFEHPVTGEQCSFEAPLNKGFERVFLKMEN
jgi:23S rRNA pseudouridine1911/1915/1917 synthase